jgi:serine protease Do
MFFPADYRDWQAPCNSLYRKRRRNLLPRKHGAWCWKDKGVGYDLEKWRKNVISYFFHRYGSWLLNWAKSFLVAGMVILLPMSLALNACGQQKKEEAPVSQPVRSAPAVIASGPQASMDLSTAIEQVAARTIPAVVHIEVIERQEVQNPFLPFTQDPFLRHFFDFPRLPRKLHREIAGLGTGMIIDAEGHILTNNHVAGGATKIEVLLANGNRYPATLVGADPKTDLAVIKIDAQEKLPYVTFADSDQTKVGQWVVAIGHPRGLDQTVTQGIISAKHRTGITDPSSYQDFLQTDAAINPGNSGGPLLNLQGEVVGVNAAIVSQSGGFEGIGFAIPGNMALHVVQQLIAHGRVERGWLGVMIQDLTPELAKSFGLKMVHGALIAEVAKGGPAAKAGMQPADIVIAFNGKEIENASALRNEVAISPIGQEATVTVLRNGERRELTVEIGNLDEAAKLLSASIRKRLGVEVRQVTAADAEKYNLSPPQGVMITKVDNNGPFGQAGFEKGDMILDINGQTINDVEGLAGVTDTLKPGQEITVLALDHRSGNTGQVQITVR